ncbi:ferrichrome outer membrane transporter [Escherichia coli]|nr:ferrichrome outer membrane transporter [Escherichia coli]
MARSKTAQPKHSLRKIAVVVATAVSGMSVYAQAAVEPKEDTITVTAAPAPQESAWGPAATIAAKHSATATKTDTPIEKTPQSISVVTREEMDIKQPATVKKLWIIRQVSFQRVVVQRRMMLFLFVDLLHPVQ